MCGIIVLKSDNITKEIKKKFILSTKYLKNRGPDEMKIFKKNNLLVGFTRLSINDVGTASQPFLSKCGKYLIVFNGEIVNYKNLANDLRRKKLNLKFGHEAEVILNLYLIYGNKCVEYLRGFFAFVIIELKSNNIFAAVDRFSIKPLYYTKSQKNYSLILTSDYSAILRSGLIEKKINFEKVIDYFTLAREFDNSTIIKNVKKLQSASILKVNKNNLNIKKYWLPFNKAIFKNERENYYLEKLDKKLNEVINLWKISDLRVSLCLSTGIDSRTLNCYINKNKINAKKFHLIERNVVPRSLNESKKIQLNSKVNSKRIIKLLNNYTKVSLNPFSIAHSSSSSLFQLYNTIVKNKFKFTLNGEGSDEHFGGYLRYNKQLKLIKKDHLNFSDSILELYKKDVSAFSLSLKKKLNIRKKLKKKIKLIKLRSKIIENKILEFDQLTWIPVLIQRHDMIGMHFGLEVRPPFLDHELAEISNRLPIKYKFDSKFKNKEILKKLLMKKFAVQIKEKRIGTPTVFDLILKNKKEMANFKKKFISSELYKFFNLKIIAQLISNPKNSKIFLWRLYILTKMLSNY